MGKGIVGLWWMLHLFATIVGWVGTFLAFGVGTHLASGITATSGLARSLHFGVLANIIAVPAALLPMLMVRQIDRCQRTRHKRPSRAAQVATP